MCLRCFVDVAEMAVYAMDSGSCRRAGLLPLLLNA
ncbi:hypothetical protein PsAD2_00266 [Pseudovibrio axinellae]|uniref:Uncharacterized protein n=1 Tax=Pseudovibrio axinellae TaxID=989403 RepID=A0A166B2V5_9HYPH|nr:hypothetical protein PsAD2_00266 [Pseudovibrio axinellae]SEQ80411.1 hypothetical protein SAMN05421798_104260 [Pseudovibrio axinellae]